MRRVVLMLASLAIAAPGLARAESTTYGPGDYAMGPQGGDANNTIMADPATGEMTVIRHNATPGSFGCGGSGGFAAFAITHEAADVTRVEVSVDDALVDPYAFVKVSARQDGDFLATEQLRGAVLGAATVTLELPEPANGELELWFGIEISSACPNVGIGHATFTAVTVG